MSKAIRSIGILIGATLVTSAQWLMAAGADTEERMQPAPAQADACSLLPKPDAAAALGETVTGPKAMSNLPAGQGATLSSCTYAGSGDHEVQLTLTNLPSSSVPMYRGMCAEKKSQDLAGLGDVACWYNEKHEELHALKGTNFISITLRKSGDPTEAIKGVMKKALDRVR